MLGLEGKKTLSNVSKKCQFNGPICSVRVADFYLFSFELRGKINFLVKKKRENMKNISWEDIIGYARSSSQCFCYLLH